MNYIYFYESQKGEEEKNIVIILIDVIKFDE